MPKIVDDINNAVDKQGGPEALRVRVELNRVGITDPVEQANVLAQIEAESALKPRSENLNYSAKRLYQIWGPDQKKNTVRFKTLDDAKAAAAKGEEHIASLIYDNRKDLGNTEAGDGYKFRGRGFIQLTGKDNYKRYGKRIGVDLIANPDLANDPEVAVKLAAEYFADKKKKGVDFKDIAAVTKAVGPADPKAVEKRTQLAQKYITPGAPPGKKSEPPSQVAMAGVLGKPPPVPDFKPAADAITGFLGNAKQAVSSAFSDLPQISAPQMPQISAPQMPQISAPQMPQISAPDLKPAADAISGFLSNAGAAASSASDNLRTSMFGQEPLSLPQISAPDLKPAADAVSSFLSGLQAPSAERPEAITPPVVDAPQSITPQPTRAPQPTRLPEPGDEPMIDRAPKIKLTRKPEERPPSRYDAAQLSALDMMTDRTWLQAASLIGADQSNVPSVQAAPADAIDAFNRGATSGTIDMGVQIDYARAGLESAMGNTDQMNIFMERAKRNEQRMADIVGPTESLKEFFEEPTVDGFFNKAGLTLGQVAPSIVATVATAFATGGASAVLLAAPQFAGKTVAVGTMKKMVKEAVVKKAKGLALDESEEKLLAGAYQAIRAARGQAFKSGATAGAFATEYPQMTGASFREFSEAGVDLNDPNYGRAALAVGGGLAAIGVFGERLIVEGAYELATKKASRLSSNQNVFALAAKDIAALGLRGAVTEGTTEALQEGALVGQRFAVDDDYSAEDAKWRIAEAGFAGALAGGAISGGAGAFTGTARALSVEPPVSIDRLRKERDVIRTKTLGAAFGPQRRPKYAGEYEAAKGATPQYAEDYKGLLHPSVEAEMRASDYTQDDKTRFEDVLNVLESAYKDMEEGNIDVAREKLTDARTLLDKTGAKKTAQYEQVQRLLRESFASLNQASKAQDPRTAAQKIMDKAKATTQAVRDKINEGRMDAEETGMSLDGPTQESEADYNAQIAHLGKTLSPKSGVWIPENSQFQFPDTLKDYEPTKADNVWVVKIPGQGVLLTRYKSDAVKLALSAQENSGGFERMLARVLGYSAVKPDDADRAVAVQDADGNIISEEATNEAGERAAVLNADKIAKAAGPGASVFVRDLKDALRSRRDRAEAEPNAAPDEEPFTIDPSVEENAQFTPKAERSRQQDAKQFNTDELNAPDQEVVDEGGMGDGPIVRNMSTNAGQTDGTVSFPLPASRALKNLPARWKDAKALLPVQWRKALTAAGLSKVDMELVIEPLLKELTEGDNSKKVSKQDLEDGLRLVEPQGRVVMQDASYNRNEKETIYGEYVPPMEFQARVFGADPKKADTGVNGQLSFGDKKNQVDYQQYQVVDGASAYREHNWRERGVVAHMRYLLYGDALLVVEIQSTAMQNYTADAAAPTSADVVALKREAEAAQREREAFHSKYNKPLNTLDIIRGNPRAYDMYPDVAEIKAAFRGDALKVDGALGYQQAQEALGDAASEFHSALYNANQTILFRASTKAEFDDDAFNDGSQRVVSRIIDEGSEAVLEYLGPFGAPDNFFKQMQRVLQFAEFDPSDTARTKAALAALKSVYETRTAADEKVVRALGFKDKQDERYIRSQVAVFEENVRVLQQRLADAGSKGAPATTTSMTLWSVWERNGLFHAMNTALDAGKDRVVLTNGAALHRAVRAPHTDADREVGYNQGLVKFYDEDLPNIAKKIAAAIGAKVEFTRSPMPIEMPPDGYGQPKRVSAYSSPGYYTIVLTPEAKAALLERRAQFEDGGKTFTRFMSTDARADALTTVDAEEATDGAVVKDYASAAGGKRTRYTPEQVKQMLDEAVPDEERRDELTRFEDALSDQAVDYIVKAYADDPDGYYFVDVIINESDEARIQIKRASTGKTASQMSVDEQIADRVDALVKAVAKDARDRKDEKKAAVPGDSFATSIVVTSSKGKRTRPSIAQLIAIGMKINRIEGADALFLGEGMSPQQAVKAGLTRAVKELALLGYTFEIDPMPQQKAAADPGSISARAAPQRAAGRSLQLNRADLRPLQQPSSIPQLKDQVVYYDKSRRITYTYADVIATADAQVRQKDRDAGYLKAYTEGRRKRSEERFIRQWMNARRANAKRFTAGNLTGDQLALAQTIYGDLSAPDDVSPGTPLHDKLRDFVDAKLKVADKEFAQNLRDREIAFDPQDIEGVSDPDSEAEMLRSAMQAYMEENPGEEVVFENQGLAQQREEDAAKDNSQLPEEAPVQSELVYEGAEKDLADRAELLAQMRPAAAAALRDNVDLVRESHIAILDAAARAGALPYMQVFAARRNNGNNTLTLRMAPIPVKDRPADYADKLRALYGALMPEAASRLRNKISFVTNKQLNNFYAIAANDPSRLEINTGEGGIINISRAKWFPGLTTPIMDLQRIIFELAKDPTAKILDGLSMRENPTPDDTLQLVKEVDRLKAFLREARAGLSFDMRTEQEMELNAAIERGEKDLRKKQDELRAARKFDNKGESKTRTTPKVQIPTRNASFKIHSAVPALVARVLGVAHGIVAPNKPVDVFTASDFEAGFQELVDSGFIPADFVPVFQQQLASMRGANGDNVYGALVFRGRYIILLNDLRADGAVSDAVMAIAAAHEMGHILFIEEFGNIEMGAIPENIEKGLLDGYTQFVNEQRANRAEVIPFEEWFSDQVGIYAYREASNEDQKRSDKESAVRRVPQKPDAISDYFKSIADKLKKLFNAVNKLFGGRLRQSQQFVDYFESVIVRRKKYAASPTTLIGVAYRNMAQQRMVNGQPQQQLASKFADDANNLLKDFMKDPINTLKRTVYATDDYLRQMGPAGVELAQFFRGRAQSKEDTGFHSAKIFEQHRWFSKLADAIGIETDKLTTDEIDTILFEAEDNTIPTARLTRKAQAVRKVFDDMYEQYITYTDANGAKKKWFAVKKAENYNPRQINTANVAIEPTGFANWLAANGFESQSDANAIAAYLAQQAGSIMPAGAGPLDAPMMPHGKARSLNQIPTKALRDALMPDGSLAPGADPKYGWLVPPQMALTQYIHFTARKVEFERRGGKAKLEALVAQLPKKKQADAVRALEANLGKLGDDIRHRPAARQFNSITQVTTAVTTLTFAVFASLPDLAGVAMRSKDFSNFMDVMRQFKRTFTDKQNAELARSVGVVTSQALDSIFMSPGEMDYTAPWAKKIMEKFFVFNGTDAYTRFARTFATGMGREFLVNTALDPAFGPQQERWLSELGVTRDEIISWHASGQPLSDMTPGTRDHAIANAIARFAEEAVIRPDSSIKPGWASNPYYNVIWQLKTYFYAYGKTIIAGMAREFKNRVDMDGDAMGAVAQLSMAIGAILILTAVGLEAREWTKYLLRAFIPWKDSEDALQTDTMDLGQYSGEIVERSGLLGPFALATSAMEGLQREGWFGPVIATVPAVDFVDDSVFDGEWDRVLPVINNL